MPNHSAQTSSTLYQWLLTALVLVCMPAFGEERGRDHALSVEEALGRALKHHPELTQSRLRLRRAQVVVDGEESSLSPVVTFNTSVTRSEEPTQGLLANGVRLTNLQQASTQLDKRFWWGMDLSLSFNATRLESETPFVLPGGVEDVQRIGPIWQEALNLTLRQPLLRGFGRDANLASLAIAEAQRDVAEVGLLQAQSQAVLEVLIAYHELAFAVESVRLRHRQLSLSREQRAATEALVSAGSVAESEIGVVEQRILLLEESLMVAENDLTSRRSELSRLLGLTNRPPPPLTPSAPLDAPAIVESEDTLIAMAMEGNLEVLTLREQLRAQRVSVRTSTDATLPQIDLTLSLGQNALSNSGFTQGVQQIVNRDADAVTAGVVIAVPLDNGRARAQLEAERVELTRLRAQLEAVERQITDQVWEGLQAVNLARRRADFGERKVALAQENLAAEQARYRAGRSTNQQVLQFQSDLEQAEEQALRARVDFIQASLRLRHLTGALLHDHQLEVQP